MDETLTTFLDGEKGGWRTFPFVTGGVVGVAMAASGVLSNLLVYLIQQFNIRSIEATQIVNVVNGCTSLSPILGAIIADSCFGCFPVAFTASVACLLGMLLFTLTAALPSLRPPPCTQTTCQGPKPGQLVVLYMASALMAAGIGGTRFNLATLGANQFDSPREQGTFFNWYFVALYVSAIMGQVGIVYIQDNSGWNCGFGLCAIIVAICLFAFLQGRRYYRHTDRKENPFVGLVNVVVLAVERRKMGESSDDQCYYYKLEDGDTKLAPRSLTPGFRYGVLVSSLACVHASRTKFSVKFARGRKLEVKNAGDPMGPPSIDAYLIPGLVCPSWALGILGTIMHARGAAGQKK